MGESVQSPDVTQGLEKDFETNLNQLVVNALKQGIDAFRVADILDSTGGNILIGGSEIFLELNEESNQ